MPYVWLAGTVYSVPAVGMSQTGCCLLYRQLQEQHLPHSQCPGEVDWHLFLKLLLVGSGLLAQWPLPLSYVPESIQESCVS